MRTTIFCWLLIFVPSLPVLFLYFAFRGVLRSKKFEMRMLLKRGNTLTRYLAAYGGASNSPSRESPPDRKKEALVNAIVDQIFQLRYSSRDYWLAIGFVVLVGAAFVALALSFAGVSLGSPISSRLVGNIYVRDIIAGGAGALVGSIYESSVRYRSEDFPSDALFTMGTRVILSGAVGAVLCAVLNPRLSWTIAFGVGMLPVPVVQKYITDRTRKALNISAHPTAWPTAPPLIALQGCNADLLDRLTRAGIFSVQELACMNPFQLFLRSNLDWRVVLDLCDQALLILYVGEDVAKLRPLGIRSAVELAQINWSRDDEHFFIGLSYTEAIGVIAAALGSDKQSASLLINSLSTDATIKFLAALWSDATPGETKEMAVGFP